jgi:trehalose 6-phosphate synthase
VRRLAALVITMMLAWLLVARLGTEAAGSAALALGVALVAASIAGWLCELIRLPRIAGYLAFGLICGPSMVNIITEPMARDLRAASGFAIALIAFTAGLQLQLSRLQPGLRTLMTMSAATFALAWLGMTVALFVAWPWLAIDAALPPQQRAAAASLMSTLLLGVSPTMIAAVAAESRARGTYSTMAAAVVVLVETAVIVLFAAALESTHEIFGNTERDPRTAVWATAWTLGGSTAFGALTGALFALYLRFVGREVTVALLALAALIAGLGPQLQVEPLLAGLAAGFVVQNVMPASGDVLRDAIERGGLPVFVIFFAAVGASIHVEALAALGVVAAGVSLLRLITLRQAARAGARLAGMRTPQAALLWRAFVPTSGITLGLAILIAGQFGDWGVRLQALMVAVVAIHELIGPMIYRATLAELGELERTGTGLVVVSNREPWMHEYAADGSIRARATPGGVAVALDALMRERGGVWIAHGAGNADKAVVDEQNSVDVPPEAPAYRLRRLWLTGEEVEGYYRGFANSALWPLCHQAHVRPQFRASDWEMYQRVNRKFADAAAVEAPPDSSVFLNDYHLALVAQELRRLRTQLRMALFWHIPWPDVDRLRICPWRREILEGLLGNDLLAFQLPRDQKNFLSAVVEEIGAAVSGDTVYHGDRHVRVLAIPIGADFDRIESTLADDQLPDEMQRLSDELRLAGSLVGVGVDRLDYTKGIPERMAAIGRLLERRPELRDRFVFVQIGVPSRGEVPGYAEISAEIDDLVARMNERFGRSADEGPIRYVKQTFALPQLVALYRLAHFCIVSSLHDGMNLVAKEFVAARDDLDGVLILSELAGAAQELSEALIINPYDEDGFTDAIERAVEMPAWERQRRMQALRRRVAGRDVLAWASDILNRLERRKGVGFFSG